MRRTHNELWRYKNNHWFRPDKGNRPGIGFDPAQYIQPQIYEHRGANGQVRNDLVGQRRFYVFNFPGYCKEHQFPPTSRNVWIFLARYSVPTAD